MVYVTTLIILLVLIAVCILRTVRNQNDVSQHVIWILVCVMFPLAAHIVIYNIDNPFVCKTAYTLYYIGVNTLLFFLLRFTMSYCDFKYEKTVVENALVLSLGADSVSIILNFKFRHMFDLAPRILSDGNLYMGVVRLQYYKIHIAVSFLCVLICLAALLTKMLQTTRFYIDRYLVIFVSLLVTTVWEAYYVIPGRPVDFSLFGYAICALLIFFFSVEYTPKTLINHVRKIVVSTISDGLLFFDMHRDCVYANEKCKVIFDIKNNDLKPIRDKMIKTIGISEEDLRGHVSYKTRQIIKQDDGDHIYDIELHKLFGGNGAFIGSFVKYSDRTEEIERNREDHYNATHDRLTGIYNAEEFYRKVEKALIENPEVEYYALGSDIKEFKLVNDRYGKDIGDKILIRLARVIEKSSNKHTFYGRIANDKFAMLIRKQDFKEDLLLKNIDKIPKLEIDSIYPIIIHVGIYEISDRSIPASAMYDRAFMAIAPIKNDITKRISYYDDALKAKLIREQNLAIAIDDAIKDGQIVPFLQAQVEKDGKVSGAEVLVRWIHPEEGFLSPGLFIPVLENTGAIHKVDRYMWECACKILAKWKKLGFGDQYLSVNISPKDFYLLDVPCELKTLVDKYGVDPSKLRLEITESIVMEDVDEKIATIEKLRSYGFIVEMDDFGSGYSSLNLLKDLPIDILKLDMLFLKDTRNPEKTEVITDLIIDLAKSLEMPVIAEGVETEDQVRMLSNRGCDYFQGYYFARPIALDEYEDKNGLR